MTDDTLGISIGDVCRSSGQRAAVINFSTWAAYPPIAEVAGPSRDSIHRSELGEVAAEIWSRRSGPDPASIKHLFALTMMWGSGTTNGRGPRNAARALSGGSVADVLTEARLLLLQADISSAYDLHGRLPGVGPAFFTKLLWVLGKTTDTTPEPLILDSFVWKSLGALDWDSRQAAGGSRRWRDRYLAYLRACAAWAGSEYSAEDVEYTLFERARQSEPAL